MSLLSLRFYPGRLGLALGLLDLLDEALRQSLVRLGKLRLYEPV